MEATEIRIGNYYQDDSERIGKLTKWISSKKVEMDMEFSTLWISFDELEPIPLTEEWLLKFGFNKNITIDLYPTFNKGVINVNDGIVYIVNFGFVNHIKHVHQIQDLYLSLTGEELKIKYENTIQNPNT